MGLFSRTKKAKFITVSTKPDEQGVRSEFNFKVWPKDGKPRGRSELLSKLTHDPQGWLLRQFPRKDGSGHYIYNDDQFGLRLLGEVAAGEKLTILKHLDEKDGCVRHYGALIDGLPDGEHVFHLDDGWKESVFYQKGEIDRVDLFDEEDRLRQETEYRHNLSYTKAYDENGELEYRDIVDQDDKPLVQFQKVSDGLLAGFSVTSYFKDGEPTQDFIHDGNDVLRVDADYTGETTIVKIYDEDRQLLLKGAYDKESKEPAGVQEYYKEGRLWFKTHADENGLQGPYTEYDEHNNQVVRGQHEDNLKEGIWEYPDRLVVFLEGRELAHGTDEDTLAQAIEERMDSKDLDIEEHDILWEALLDLAARMMSNSQNDPSVPPAP